MRRIVVTLLLLVIVSGTPEIAGATGFPQKRFGNCEALLKVFPYGVARDIKAQSQSSEQIGMGWSAWPVKPKIYSSNKRLDSDGDGVVCEEDMQTAYRFLRALEIFGCLLGEGGGKFGCCDSMRRTYPNGVAKDWTSAGKSVLVDATVYWKNVALDSNRNGVACDSNDMTYAGIPSAPTTTTTTNPPSPTLPLTVTYTQNQDMSYSGGIQGVFNSNLDFKNIGKGTYPRIAKVCFTFDGAPLPDYKINDRTNVLINWLFTYQFPQSGGLGCYVNPTSGTGVYISLNWALPGAHTLTATFTDSSGRSATSVPVNFVGR